ncbi:MAG: LysR family transcriptional regulator [Myxococcales bacterium]|nr:LysR family transcriptional regulator [Myxococcales bacterium]
MELTTIRQFVHVAESGSFVGGARRSHVTPPAITKAIKKLEAELETALFFRTTRRVRLTAAGEVLLARCQRILREVEAARAELDGLSGGVSGELRIAANEVLSLSLLPKAIARLVGEHPGVRPRCYEMVPGRFEPLLVEGRLDLACTIGGRGHPELRQIVLGHSPGCLVCGPTHPLFARGSICEAEIERYPSVVPEFFDLEHLPVLDQFPDSRWPRRVGATIELLQMGVQLTLDGAYLGFFPRVSIAEHLAAGRLRALDGLEQQVSFALSVVVRANETPRPACAALIEALRLEARALL